MRWLLVATVLVATARGQLRYSPSSYLEKISSESHGEASINDADQAFCSQLSYADLRYRQIDGRCNHPLNHGMTGRPVKRYLRAHYQDPLGQNSPRIYGIKGDELPSARMVSWKLHPDQTGHDDNTMLVMQMGQFIDHDITVAPVLTSRNSSVRCCSIPEDERLPECFPILIPEGDPTFSECMDFYRSDPVTDKEGQVVYPREQINSLTSYIDASGVYGSDLKTSKRLRSSNGTGALLNTVLVDGKERLPLNPDINPAQCVSSNTAKSYCQLAGDGRVNEQPGLGSIHLLFHLHHNHLVRLLVAGILKKRGQPVTRSIVDKFIQDSPQYLQERLFQEAKKILGAIIQKITYCDWLPIIIGPDLIGKFKLGCEHRSKYNPQLDPRVDNGFLCAAFRFGHTLIPNGYNLGSKTILLKDNFNIPDASILYFDELVRCLVQEGSEEAYDRYISSSVSEHLFEATKGKQRAQDLVALNIQRARDHGIPAYYFWREHYGLRTIKSLDEFGEAGIALKKIYKSIKDLDLFPGGMLEPSVPGGVVGETFGHILANQFSDIKYGDAYFFLSQEAPQGFLADQVKAIMSTSMANIICRHSEVQQVQANPFYMASDELNPVRPCSEYPDLDVEPWMLYF